MLGSSQPLRRASPSARLLGYCPMTNHIHPVAVPEREDSLLDRPVATRPQNPPVTRSWASKVRSEHGLAIVLAILLAAFATLIDAAALYQTYHYFGGGALNRPFALRTHSQYLAFFLESAGYDFLFYTALLWGSLWLLLRLWGQRLKPVQRLLLAAVSLALLIVGATVLRYKIFQYFSDKFTFQALKDLTSGHLTNMFSWISGDTFVFLAAVPVLIVVLALLVRRVGRLPVSVRPFQAEKRAVLVMAGGAVVLLANHVWIAPDKELRYGLSTEVSYGAIDTALRSVWEYDRNPYVVQVAGQVAHASPRDVELARSVAPDGVWAPIAKTNRKNVFVIVVETFRSDVTEMNIQGDPVMPSFASLARQNAATVAAVSDYGITSRAILTVLSGMLHFHDGTDFMPAQLRRLGYRLNAVSAQEESWGDVKQLTGMDHFDSYYDASMRKVDQSKLTTYEHINHVLITLDAENVVKHVFDAVDQSPPGPLFFYINFQDLHYPYYTAEIPLRFIDKGRTESSFFTAGNAPRIKLQYANAANHLDQALGHFVEGLKARGLWDNSVVVVVGDHPDSIYENGLLGHAWSLHPSQRFTPLLVVHGKGEMVAPASQTDRLRIVRDSLDPDANLPPLTMRDDPAKKIFTIAGPLEQPRYLGFLSLHRLVQYDVEANRIQFGNSPWMVPSSLKKGSLEVREFAQLMTLWRAELVLKSMPQSR